MKNIFTLVTIIFFALSCEYKNENIEVKSENWKARAIKTALFDSLVEGTSYLSVYSQIYSQSEHRTHDLTATISMRNTSVGDTIYLDKAEYFNTHGKLIRTYFDKTIFIAPLETLEIVINESDQEGGTGGNFIFEWKVKPGDNEPLFECVMISTSGQQGISFSTQGKRIQ